MGEIIQLKSRDNTTQLDGKWGQIEHILGSKEECIAVKVLSCGKVELHHNADMSPESIIGLLESLKGQLIKGGESC